MKKNTILDKQAIYSLYIDGNTRLHIVDGNKKLGHGIYSINLLPGDKPVTLKDGRQLYNIAGSCAGCCEACEGDCYAINYTRVHHNTVVISAGENTLLARHDLDKYFSDFEYFITKNIISVVRMHSSGEFLSYEYFTRFIKFTKQHPEVKFYTYTKRFNYIEKYINAGGSIEDINGTNNLVINVSIWHGNYSNPYNLPSFEYDDGSDATLASVPHCPAVGKDGHETGITCAVCRGCINAKPGQRKAVYAH